MAKMLRFLSLLFVALALIPAAAPLIGLPKISRWWECAYLMVMSAPIILFVVWRAREVSLSTFIALLCIIGMQVVFWLFTFPANQQTTHGTALPANWSELRNRWEYSYMISAVLNLIALITLIHSVLSEIPPNKATEATGEQEERIPVKDPSIALSLYTFYEGRVQSAKSILVGILTGILSLQASFLGIIFTEDSPSFGFAVPIIVLFIISLPVFQYLRRHMSENDSRSKHFQKPLDKVNMDYRPHIEPSNVCFRLELDWVLLIAIAILVLLSIFFINYKQ